LQSQHTGRTLTAHHTKNIFMPVRIDTIDKVSDPNNPEVISLAEYEAGRANFVASYFLNDCNTAFGGQDFDVPWANFYSAVTGFISTYGVDPATVALRFVYCYDTAANALYLRMQILTMTADEGVPDTFNLVPTQCAWYKLENGAITSTSITSLSDPNYLNYFYYCAEPTCTEATSQNLAADITDTLYARTVTFPWAAEVLAMYTDNGLTGDGSICFGATSYVDGGEGALSPIEYPHGMVIYLKDADGNALIDNNTEIVLFHNKGCDMGTLCPPCCDIYIVPTS